MKYIILGSLMLATVGQANEIESEADWRASYSYLETQHKNLESMIAKASENQNQLVQEVANLSDLRMEITHYKQIVNELSQQNHDLLNKIQEKEGKELVLKSTLNKIEGVLEKVQSEIASLDQRETQQKSKYQSLNARIDNLTQQVEEVHRQVAMKKGKK